MLKFYLYYSKIKLKGEVIIHITQSRRKGDDCRLGKDDFKKNYHSNY